MNAFSYTAVQSDGTPMHGTIDATSTEDAVRRLAAMGLQSIAIAPAFATAVAPTMASPATDAAGHGGAQSRLRPADLQTFNEYLLQISRAGLPIEGGLTALSRELQSGKLKDAIDALANDLRSGVPLEKAVAGRRGSFPPLYGHLIDAGVQSADLPGVLGRFGKHAQTVADLRSALWRACSYPAVVFIALLILLAFLGYGVLPKYFMLVDKMGYQSYHRVGPGLDIENHQVSLPAMAWAMLYLGRLAPYILGLMLFAGVALAVIYFVLRSTGNERGMVDTLTRLPIIGRALRDSYVASWLDIASLGAAAGLDLPRALRLAGNAVALPSIQHDTDAIVGRLESGQPVGDVPMSRLPATVPLAIEMATGPGQLPEALSSLANQFEQQARRQIAVLPSRVMPALLVCIGLLAGGIMYSLWVPLAQLLSGLTGSY
ncbi:MAG: pilC [Phycisphaerales bacterium]|nr:pilC [Phycisphaerales bacterium]